MKGFYWGSGVVHCGFCGAPHHNITTCKLVAQIASKALHNLNTIPRYTISTNEYEALSELKRREERKVKVVGTKRKRRAPRCSYCKSTEHKRPKCNSLINLKQLVYKANKNWRRLLVSRINECGLGVGALIEIKTNFIRNLGFDIESDGIVMITGYNTKDLNVFCSLDTHSQYQSNSTFRIMSGESVENISVKFLSSILNYGLLSRGWWYSEPLPKVLSPMKWEPSEEWLEGEWDEIMNWFFDDINEKDLNDGMITPFIEKWADMF